MTEFSDLLPLIKDIVLVVATAFATAFVTTRLRERSIRNRAYKGFLQEIKQNISHAEHNIAEEKCYSPFFFRDDFWNMSKASGYFLDLPLELQSLLYEVYVKQYEINESIANYKALGDDPVKGFILSGVIKETKTDLLPKLRKVEKLLQRQIDP